MSKSTKVKITAKKIVDSKFLIVMLKKLFSAGIDTDKIKEKKQNNYF